MKLGTYLFLASRLALSRKASNLLSAIFIITLSLIPLVVVMEVSQGMTQGIIARYLEVSTYHFRATPMVYQPSNEELRIMANNLKAIDTITAVIPQRENYALAFSSSGRQGVQLRGMDRDFYEQDIGMREYLSIREGTPDLNQETILIGESLASELELGVGDVLRVLSVEGQSGRPFFRAFDVGGIVSVGYDQLDKTWVFMDRNVDIFFNANNNSQSFLGIKIENPFVQIDQKKSQIQALLPEDWIVTDWYTANYGMIENLKMTTLILVFILGLIVCVAITNTTGALHVFFLSRRKEIALLKAIGVSPQQIKQLFIVLGLFTGVCGSILGVAFGAIFATQINGIIWLLEVIQNLWVGLFYSQDFSGMGGESFYLEKTHVSVRWHVLFFIVVGVTLWSALINLRSSKKIADARVLTILRKI
ncbi:MAG: ABC transporter permease [Spirochaetia bacterium]